MKSSAASLFAEIADVKGLEAGWDRVRKNKGAPGIDGITVADFQRNIAKSLCKLSQELYSGAYHPHPLRSVSIQKKNGKRRQLSIPIITDRIIQSSAQIVLARKIDPLLSPASYGYRPGRGVRDAVGKSRNYLKAGLQYVLDADIEQFFDKMRHDILEQELSIWISDMRLLRLMQAWLKEFSGNGIGVAQGSPISPFFANLYLHPLDKLLIADGFRVVRYADDFLVFARNRPGVDTAQTRTQKILHQRSLSLNNAKTFIRSPGETFPFLGMEVVIPAQSAHRTRDKANRPEPAGWLKKLFRR